MRPQHWNSYSPVKGIAAAVLLVLSTTGAFAAAVPTSLQMQIGKFDPATSRPQLPEAATYLPERASKPSGEATYHVVQFIGPIMPDWQDAIRATGATPSHYIPDFALTVKMTQAQAAKVQQFSFVRWVGEFDPRWRVSPLVLADVLNPADGQADWNVVGFPGENIDAIADEVQRAAGTQRLRPPDRRGGKITIRALGPSALTALQQILQHDAIAWVEPYVPFKLSNNHSIWVGQSLDKTNGPAEADDAAAPSEFPVSGTIWARDILGQGQVIAFGDSGLNHTACFATDASNNVAHTNVAAPDALTVDNTRRKVIAYNVLPGAADGDHHGNCSFGGCCSHGSHVFGSIAGDNNANLSTATTAAHDAGDGMAPQSKVIVQDIGSGNTTSCSLGGIPSDLRDYFKQAYDAGARLHSNSWGSAVDGAYTSEAQETDEYMFTNEDLLVLFAAGNDGPNADTIGSPATAKNCITVAAGSNGADSSRAENIVDFSSQGPTDDGRIKPDISAPGVSIVSMLGNNACATTTMSGTSMATPTMAGLAALARQYFTEGWYPSGTKTPADAFTPSSQLQKAVLYASARAMTGIRTGGGALAGSPSNDQGWGRALLDDGLFFSSGETGKMRVWDIRNCSGVQTGQIAEYAVEVATGKPLHIVVSWNDAPASLSAAKQLVNDVNLEVIAPNGTVYRGNQWNAATQTAKESTPNPSAWDDTNNSEGVQIASPAAGVYRIRIHGFNIPGFDGQFKQGYGLAAVGNVTTTCTLAAPTGVTASVPAANEVALTWNAVAGATRYLIFRAPEGASDCSSCMQQIGSSTTTSYTDTTVNGGFTYYYYVKTLGACDSGPSSCVSAAATGNCTNKPAFDGLTSAASAGTSSCAVDLSWSAATSNCPSAPSVTYNIYRSTTPNFTASSTNRVRTCVSGTSFTDTGLTSGTTYYYVVRAEDGTTANGGPCNGGNEETNDVIRKATPYGSGTGSTGTWTDGGGDTNSELTLTGPWSIVSTADSATFVRTGTYAYKTSPGTSNYAANVCAAATTPTLTVGAANPVVTFFERHAIELNWDAVIVQYSVDGGPWTVATAGTAATMDATNAVGLCGFDKSTQGYEGNGGNASTLTAWTSRSFTITAGVSSTVAVRWYLATDGAVEEQGFVLDDISITNIALPNSCTACTPPSTPSGLTATPNGVNQIDLSWSDVSGETEYRIYRTAGSSCTTSETLLATVSADTTTYADTTATGDNTYSYRISAFATCESAKSSCVTATAQSCTTPNPPGTLSATTPANNEIKLDWGASATGGVTYTVYRADSCSGTFSSVASGLSGLTWTDTGIAGGTSYSYRVAAFDATCKSSDSNCVSAAATGGPGNYSRETTNDAQPQDTAAASSLIRWMFNTTASSLTPPATDSTNVYAVSNDRFTHGMQGGDQLGNWPAGWRPAAMNQASQSRPIAMATPYITDSPRTIFLGSHDGYVYAVNAATGARTWRSTLADGTDAPLGEMIQAAPRYVQREWTALTLDLVIVGTRNSSGMNKIIALDAASGRAVWEFTNATSAPNSGDGKEIGIISQAPYVDTANKRIFFATRRNTSASGSDATVWALSFTATGATLLWKQAIGDVDGGAEFFRSRVYVGTNAGDVYALDAATGAFLWTGDSDQRFSTNDGPVKKFITADRSSTPARLYFSTTNKLWAITDNTSTNTPDQLWVITSFSGPSTPVITGSRTVFNGRALLLGSSNGYLHQLTNLGSATPTVKSTQLGTDAVGEPVFTGTTDFSYVGTDAGTVFAVKAQ